MPPQWGARGRSRGRRARGARGGAAARPRTWRAAPERVDSMWKSKLKYQGAALNDDDAKERNAEPDFCEDMHEAAKSDDDVVEQLDGRAASDNSASDSAPDSIATFPLLHEFYSAPADAMQGPIQHNAESASLPGMQTCFRHWSLAMTRSLRALRHTASSPRSEQTNIHSVAAGHFGDAVRR